MSTINTGYTNVYSNPATATSTPANFGPGQVKTDNEQAEGSRSKAQEASENERKTANTGYTTASRGSQLNITA